MAFTGLQRNVIGMAFCCKKGGGQSIKGVTATAKRHTAIVTGTACITVLRRDWAVVAGADLRHETVTPARRLHHLSTSARISLRIHHNGKSTDFEQTLGPGTTINLNALTCCVLCFAEQAAVDQAAPMWNLFSALCPCHNIESTTFTDMLPGEDSAISSNALIVASSSLPRCHTVSPGG